MLVDKNNQPLNQKLGDGELWAVALENALAQYRGGYDNIVAGFAEQGTLDFLKICLEQGNPVTFSTKGIGVAEAERIITVAGQQQVLFEEHTYALDKIEGKFIHLYNPHGSNHLKIDIEVLEEFFMSVYYNSFTRARLYSCMIGR